MNRIEKLVKRLFWVPFILAVIGYCVMEKVPVFEGLYASAALYYVNPVVDANKPVILLAKILALLVVTGFVLSILGNVWKTLKIWVTNLHRDSACVYTDCEAGETLAGNLRHAYVSPGTEGKREFRSHDHIFLYEDERDALKNYVEAKDHLRGKGVFIGLRRTDPFLLRDTVESDLHYFNVNQLVARDFWKRFNLYDEVAVEGKKVRIAIPCYNGMGEAIFRYGYMNNIYSLTQEIEYHIWGCNELQKEFLKALPMENGDRIVIHDGEWTESVDEICGMSRLILTSEDSLDVVQEILYRDTDIKIYLYSESRLGYAGLLKTENLTEFGCLDDLLTDDNVRDEKLYRQAKLNCYDYHLRKEGRSCPKKYKKEMEECWKKQSGFLRGSNIARADHFWIKARLEKKGLTVEQLQELEHIRWCRYHRINRWEYNPVRNNERRQHNCLIPYDQLDELYKKNDAIYDEKLRKEIWKLL